MYGKLVHRPPFGHHCHAPRPPFGEPREVGERYLGHPELTDYWIKPYLLEALKHYPRLDDECVVEGLWKFANTICLQNKHTSIRTPPTYDDPVTTHKIAFLDKDDIELGCIKFWRKVDSTFGIDMILNGRGISITGNNDDPTLCLVDTPVGDNKKQIVNIEYLDLRSSTLQELIDGLTDRVGALETYKDQADSLIRDPNGNFRTVHTAIHNDSDDQNIPTCYAVYQFGEAIRNAIPVVENAVHSGSSNVPTENAVYSFVTSAITNGINGISLPVASTSQKGIMQVGDYLSVNNGLVSVDINAILQAVRGSGSSGSGGGGNDSYIFAYPSGSPDGFDLTLESINAWDIVTGDHIASAVEVSIPGSQHDPEIVTYTINQDNLDSNEFTYAAYYGSPKTVYNPTTLSSSDSYRCITPPMVARGSGAGGAGDSRPFIRIKAGVFQRIASAGSGSGPTIQAIWYTYSITPHTTYSSTVGNTYPGIELYLPNGTIPNGTSIGGSGDYTCVTASSYYVGDIDSSGPHYGTITVGTFKKIE